MPRISTTHAVLIPTFNTGPRVLTTVRNAMECWLPVWVVVDGSVDGTGEALEEMAASLGGLTVIRLARNSGKGAAVLAGAEAMREAGFSHVLTMDADGQHSETQIEIMMESSQAHPLGMILGEPIFDESAPALRVRGRRISNWWVNFETLWGGIHDSLFGFRVYPLTDLIWALHSTRFARGFDLDAEAAVRLFWRGVKPVNVPTPVRYFSAEEGGVSQFRYFRDNALLTWMHLRLIIGFLARFPRLLILRLRRRGPYCRDE